MQKDAPFNISIEPISTFAPLIASQLLNAYYSSLLLKQQSGVEITSDVRSETIGSVFALWAEFSDLLLKKHLHAEKTPETENQK